MKILTTLNKKNIVTMMLFLTSVLPLTSCDIFSKNIKTITLPLNEQQQVDSLVRTSSTRCVGTYLIDLPIEFKIPKEGTLYYKDNFDITITARPQSLSLFKQMIDIREQELQSTKVVKPIYAPFLKTIHPLHTNNPEKMQGVIFERMRSIDTSDIAKMLEGYRWQEQVALNIKMKALDFSDEKYDEARLSSPDIYVNNVFQKLKEMHELFKRIEPRDDLTIPTKPGFCLLNTFMQGEDREKKYMKYDYLHTSINNFYFHFEFNDFHDDYELLEKPEGYITRGKGNTIYKGTRKSHGLKLEEWVVKGKYFQDKNDEGLNIDRVGYIFTLGINMTKPSYQKPKLQIKMFYEIPEDETKAYSEEQLMVIWREITNSIKMRESAFESN